MLIVLQKHFFYEFCSMLMSFFYYLWPGQYVPYNTQLHLQLISSLFGTNTLYGIATNKRLVNEQQISLSTKKGRFKENGSFVF